MRYYFAICLWILTLTVKFLILIVISVPTCLNFKMSFGFIFIVLICVEIHPFFIFLFVKCFIKLKFYNFLYFTGVIMSHFSIFKLLVMKCTSSFGYFVKHLFYLTFCQYCLHCDGINSVSLTCYIYFVASAAFISLINICDFFPATDFGVWLFFFQSLSWIIN